jgi:hypothetical protein
VPLDQVFDVVGLVTDFRASGEFFYAVANLLEFVLQASLGDTVKLPA